MNDLIYRQDAINAIENTDAEITAEEWDELTNAIKALPSADRPIGEWVAKDGETVCSLCGNSVSFSRTEDGWVLGKFCQTCGARMKGGVE